MADTAESPTGDPDEAPPVETEKNIADDAQKINQEEAKVDTPDVTELTPQPDAPPPSLADPTTQESTAGGTPTTTALLPAPPPPSLADSLPTENMEETLHDDLNLSEEQIRQSIEELAAAHSAKPTETHPEVGLTTSKTQSMASDIIFDIIQNTLTGKEGAQGADDLFPEVSEQDQLTAFIEDTIGALADDISLGEREYISHSEAYFWMTYFFLQFCGFRMFLANIDIAIAHGDNLKDMAKMIAELVDTVSENAEYLHMDSDLPEHVAKNIIWQILNSKQMQCRYSGKSVSVCQVEDILDEILNKATGPKATTRVKVIGARKPPRPKLISPPPQQEHAEPQICHEFGGIFRIAEAFVDNIMDKSLNIVRRSQSFVRTSKSDRSSICLDSTKGMSVIYYPRIEEFTIKVGTRFLRSIVHQWKAQHLQEDWACSIRFILGQSDSCSNYYIYEGKFGLPTPLYPVTQANCSLLFNIEVSRVKPPGCFINLTYKVEGSGFQYDPLDYAPQESWLLNVIDAKLALFSRVTF